MRGGAAAAALFLLDLAAARFANADCAYARLEASEWSNMRPEDFEALYLSRGLPVVFSDIGQVWPIEAWTVNALTRDFGSDVFRFGQAPYPTLHRPLADFQLSEQETRNIFQYGQVPASYSLKRECRAQYVQPYSFSDWFHANASVACRLLDRSRLIAPLHGATVRFAGLIMGKNGTTTLRHRHDAAVNHLLVGAKQWEMWNLNGDHVGACTQRAGEAVFIPSGFDHEVVSLGESVAVQLQWHENHFLSTVGHAELERAIGSELEQEIGADLEQAIGVQ